jgi:hypothetical protein
VAFETVQDILGAAVIKILKHVEPAGEPAELASLGHSCVLQGHQTGDRSAGAGDQDFLAVCHSIKQTGEVGLGGVDIDGLHDWSPVDLHN